MRAFKFEHGNGIFKKIIPRADMTPRRVTLFSIKNINNCQKNNIFL